MQEKILSSGTSALIISNEEMIDIMKTGISLENSDVLIKGFPQTIENEVKKQRDGFWGTVCYKIHWVLVY